MWYWNWFLLPTSVNSGNSPCALSPFGKCNFLTYIYMYTLFPSKLTFEYVWLFLGSNGRGKQTCDDNHKTKEGGGEERNAIREEQDKKKPRARDTSHWHLFWPPREKKRKQHESRLHHEKTEMQITRIWTVWCNIWNDETERCGNLLFFFVCLNALIIRGRRMDRTCFPTGRASGLLHLDLVSKATTTYWLLSRLLHVCSSFRYPGWVEKV